MDAEKIYRVYVPLSESEAVAITKLGDPEMRDLRSQTKYLVIQKLKELGVLTKEEDNVQSDGKTTNYGKNEIN